MRHLELSPIIHVEIYKKCQLDPSEDLIDRERLNALCEASKSVLETKGEYEFINYVSSQYAKFLITDQPEAQ
jgi:hypothetical protein